MCLKETLYQTTKKKKKHIYLGPCLQFQRLDHKRHGRKYDNRHGRNVDEVKVCIQIKLMKMKNKSLCTSEFEDLK